MTVRELNWIRQVIHSLRTRGCLYGIEEFRQPVFHIMVYRNYPEHVKTLTVRASAS